MKKQIMDVLIKAREICQKLGFMSGILQKDTTKTYLAKYRFISMDYYARFSGPAILFLLLFILLLLVEQ